MDQQEVSNGYYKSVSIYVFKYLTSDSVLGENHLGTKLGPIQSRAITTKLHPFETNNIRNFLGLLFLLCVLITEWVPFICSWLLSSCALLVL